MRNFNLIIVNHSNNGILNHYICSEEDLVQKLKDAKFEENKWIVWEKGCMRTEAILGIIET